MKYGTSSVKMHVESGLPKLQKLYQLARDNTRSPVLPLRVTVIV